MSAITGSLGIACSDIQFKLQDGTPICGRNMDFPNIEKMQSRLSIHRIGEEWKSTAPDGSVGFSWKSSIGFLGISAFNSSTDPNSVDDVVDGLNAQGLSGGVLTLQASAYQEVPTGQNSQAITQMDLLPYLLGTCVTVAEVEAAIKNLFVWAIAMPPLPTPPQLHYSFHDRNGDNLVVEFLGGIPQFYPNPIGVLTNDPPFVAQQENLAKYAALSPSPLPSTTLNGVIIPSPGAGSGTIGLPGSTDPQSRYVTLAKLIQFTQENAILKDVWKGVIHAEALLGRVHVIEGEQLIPLANNIYLEATLWSVIKVLGKKLQLVYFSKLDPSMRLVSLSEIDFSPSNGPKIKIPVASNYPSLIDVTEKLAPKHQIDWHG